MKEYIKKQKNNYSLRIRAIKQYVESLNYHVTYKEAVEELNRFSINPHTSCYCANGNTKWGGMT